MYYVKKSMTKKEFCNFCKKKCLEEYIFNFFLSHNYATTQIVTNWSNCARRSDCRPVTDNSLYQAALQCLVMSWEVKIACKLWKSNFFT